MKNCYKSIFIVFFIFTCIACNNWDDLNIDPKHPNTINPDFLFTNALKDIADWTSTADATQQVGRLAAQYLAQVDSTKESRYEWTRQPIAEHIWSTLYTALTNLKEARRLIASEEAELVVQANKLACITTIEAFTYQILVDLFGDIPYSEAADATKFPYPVYDDAAFIYKDLLERLDPAIREFDTASPAFGAADLIYSGNVTAWKKFANTIRLRLGIRLAEVNPSLAREIVETAASRGFSSNADNAIFRYQDDPTSSNPLGRSLSANYVLANTLVDSMNSLRDPRRRYYMTAINAQYIGNQYGRLVAAEDEEYSQVHPRLKAPNFPAQLFSFAEVAFILAEAAERGWNIDGSAETWYEAGVRASIIQWGGTSSEAIAYLNNKSVRYGTAAGGNNLNAIALQKWIALYYNGYQGWIEWRRLDYPQFTIPEALETRDIAVRHLYPQEEALFNASNYAAAASAIGGDALSTKVFWDLR